MERLHPDLTMEILSRLPLRSLLRAKCVCRSWLTITSDKKFIKFHLINRPTTHDAILLTYPDSFSWKNFYFVEEPKPDFPASAKQIDISFINGLEQQCPYVLGGCNGLLCISIYPQINYIDAVVYPSSPNPFDFIESKKFNPIFRPIYILNPITGEYHQIPDCDFKACGNKAKDARYAFGFDETRNVFKVVVFLGSIKADVMNEMQVYTIGVGGNNTWRRQVGNVPKLLFFTIQIYLDSFVNGSFHLFANTTIPPDDKTVIISFNLGSEDFQVIQPPESIAVTSFYIASHCYTLGVVNDCLSIVDALDDKLVEIWLRKNDYGTMSWVKHFSLHKEFIAPIPFESIRLIRCQNDGELLLMRPNCLVVYNVENNTSKIVEIAGLEEPEQIYGFRVILFAGSLISIDVQA